jgi:hypothetical protein
MMKIFKVMIKRFLQLSVLFVLLFSTACTGDIETISVERNPSLSFKVEGVNGDWKSSSFQFYPGQSVVHVFTDEPVASILFQRYYVVFSGTSPTGEAFEMAVVLDLPEGTDLRHEYTQSYDRQFGGLYDMSLILTRAGNPPTYTMASLCPDTAGDAFFLIDRQSTSEKILAGSFGGTLCSQTPPETTFVIYNAVFQDIPYIYSN